MEFDYNELEDILDSPSHKHALNKKKMTMVSKDTAFTSMASEYESGYADKLD